ncbi:hypothetical protein HZQ94_02130 [Elizabethkingia anophelis]|nr:hypothetical protein [Elizabethkingia anophelis]MCT3679041.1 hypothetical protein [Elizabethkingia anophelis]
MDLAVLTLPKGFQVHYNGSVKIITEVPEDALELIEKGCTWLILKTDAVEVLSSWDKSRLEKLRDLRKQQGIKHDVVIIEATLKSIGKTKAIKETK